MCSFWRVPYNCWLLTKETGMIDIEDLRRTARVNTFFRTIYIWFATLVVRMAEGAAMTLGGYGALWVLGLI